ncbi:hypothetical protein [Clavibacter michiganensis]|uniref:hypothetical protein n=1 Tax=Clavibacter michiganensis TaxID=28447 RepID=UPI001FB1A466|nr:hypothetical protein [Clavibacter michiganensis]
MQGDGGRPRVVAGEDHDAEAVGEERRRRIHRHGRVEHDGRDSPVGEPAEPRVEAPGGALGAVEDDEDVACTAAAAAADAGRRVVSGSVHPHAADAGDRGIRCPRHPAHVRERRVVEERGEGDRPDHAGAPTASASRSASASTRPNPNAAGETAARRPPRGRVEGDDHDAGAGPRVVDEEHAGPGHGGAGHGDDGDDLG